MTAAPIHRLLAALDHASEDVLIAALEKIATLLQGRRAAAGAAFHPVLPAPQIAEWKGPEQAAALRGCHRETMIAHAEKFGLGFKKGGVWKIDMVRVRAYDNGQPYEPLRRIDFPDP